VPHGLLRETCQNRVCLTIYVHKREAHTCPGVFSCRSGQRSQRHVLKRPPPTGTTDDVAWWDGPDWVSMLLVPHRS
jgi:hypothetical protein